MKGLRLRGVIAVCGSTEWRLTTDLSPKLPEEVNT